MPETLSLDDCEPTAPAAAPKKPIILRTDEGWFRATVRTAEGAEVAVCLDTLKSHNVYAAILNDHADEGERAEAWIRYLMDAGVPHLSHGAAWRVAEMIIEEVKGRYAPR